GQWLTRFIASKRRDIALRRSDVSRDQTFARPAIATYVAPTKSRRPLLLHERPLVHVLPRHADARRGGETAGIEQGAEVGQHLRTAADHRAVVFGIQRRQAEIVRDAAAGEQFGQPSALVASGEDELLARHRRVVLQFRRDLFAKELVPWEFVDDV